MNRATGTGMATVISLREARIEQPALAPRLSTPADVFDLVERRNAHRTAADAAEKLAARAQRLGTLDGQTVQVCWEDPAQPGQPRFAIGFQYAHTETELLLAFYTSGPDKMGPTLAVPIAGIRTVLQLAPERVCY